MTRIENDMMTLHEHYVEAVNLAVAHDDHARVDRLAAEFDVRAVRLRERAAG